jgi:hypothetical protein
VNWSDYEFIAEEPLERPMRMAHVMLTGWETIRFEICDEDDDEVATFCPRPAALRR